MIETIPHENRWSPVMQRYLRQVAGRVKALGGSEGHSTGVRGEHEHWHRDHHREGPARDEPNRSEERLHFEGKVAGICFDHFGDFEGFWLRMEEGMREFSTRERDMQEIVTRAWRECIAVVVVTDADEPREPRSLVFLRAPVDRRGG